MNRFGISPAKFWGLAAVAAIPAFVLFKPVFVDNAPAGPDPEGAQAGLLILESALSSIALGIGIAMLVFGGRVVRTLPADLQGKGRIVQVALFWTIAPWLIHTGFHITNREGDFARLVAVEYGFHVTTYVAAIVAAFTLASIARSLFSEKSSPARPA